MFDVIDEVEDFDFGKLSTIVSVQLPPIQFSYIRLTFTIEPMEFEDDGQRQFIFGELKKEE